MCCSGCCGLTQHVKANPRPSAALLSCLMVILTEHTTGHKQTSGTRGRERGRESEIIETGGKKERKRERHKERVREREAEGKRKPEFFQASQPCGSLSSGADLQQDLQIEGQLCSTPWWKHIHTHTHTPNIRKHKHTTIQSLTTALYRNHPWTALSDNPLRKRWQIVTL